MKNFFKDKKNGFSMIEVIVSLFIISTALTGVMTLISHTVSSSGASASRLAAAELAQEGIEVVKNIRDLNFDANGWDDCYSTYVGTNDYLIQYNDTALRPFISEYPLRFDSLSGLYGYDAGADTPYKRRITLSKNPSGSDENEILVTVQVTWTEKGRSNALTVEDRIWNWR